MHGKQQIIIMEEQQREQLIKFLVKSTQLQQLTIHIHDSKDALISTFVIPNYNTHTIHLNTHLTNFYCILTNAPHSIQEQFQIKIHEPLTHIAKTFSCFTIDIKIEATSKVSFRNFIEQQNQLSRFVVGHLKRLQNNLFKKMEMEELKRSLKDNKASAKGCVRKAKNKSHLTTLVKFSSNNQAENERYSYNNVLRKDKEGGSSMIKTLSKLKPLITDDSQISQQSQFVGKQFSIKSKKHNTLFENHLISNTQISSKQQKEEESIKIDNSYYDQFIQALRCGNSKENRDINRKFIRYSHKQRLLLTTTAQIERQKKALQVVKMMKGVYSREPSPNKTQSPFIKNHKKSSPYLQLNSKVIIRRKMN